MNTETLLTFLGWCTVINYGFLLLWVLLVGLARNWIYDIHCNWISVSREQFNGIHYFLLGWYKLNIFLFLLVPYIVLRLLV